ncbi:MAG: hypothetical protein HY539_04775 [Deltaproteobacteria bacterium]|nr:hypothetical protein [Deltaproteobacteria bacterium]
MSIQGQLQRILELSLLDKKIDQILKRTGHVPARQAEIKNRLAEKERLLEGKKGKQAELEKQRRDLEGELSFAKNRLSEFEVKVNSIKTNKEYQAATKEIGEMKRGISEAENKLLGLMATLEGLAKEIETEGPALLSEQEVAQKELNDLQEEQKTVEEETKNFREQRESILSSLEAPILAMYQRVKKVRLDAIAVVTSGTCEGCYMRLPPQLFIELQRFQKVYSCPSCHRILCLGGGVS